MVFQQDFFFLEPLECGMFESAEDLVLVGNFLIGFEPKGVAEMHHSMFEMESLLHLVDTDWFLELFKIQGLFRFAGDDSEFGFTSGL